jgi:aminoglycoside phosphotransferase (APT) family kinase protein
VVEAAKDGTTPPVGDWTRARRALRRAFEGVVADRRSQLAIGRAIKVGSGASRRTYAANVSLNPDPRGLSGTYVAVVAKPDADDGVAERTTLEFRVLERLSALPVPIRVPHPVAAPADGQGVALVRSYLEGSALPLQAGGPKGAEPWTVLGAVAAGVHNVDGRVFSGVLEDPGSRRGHALARLEVFDGLDDPVARDADGWARGHLPPEEPAALLHGDLFGRNIFLKPGQPPGVIDWECASLGDPAYELAVITRGSRRPFGIPDGLARLLEAYAARGATRRVTREHVHVHALCLAAEVYRYSVETEEASEAPEMALGRLRKLLEQVA